MTASVSRRCRRRSCGSFAGPKPQRRVKLQPRLIVITAERPSMPPKRGSASRACSPIRPRQGSPTVPCASLRLILEDYELEAAPVSLVHREDRLPQAKVQSFIAFAVARLRKQLKRLDRLQGDWGKDPLPSASQS